MTKDAAPDRCPSCGAEGTLVDFGEEWHCSDELCGRSFPKVVPGARKKAPKAGSGKAKSKGKSR